MRVPTQLMPHRVIVQACIGHGDGPVYDGPVTVRSYVEDKTRLVRDASGQEVTSTAAVWLDPEIAAPELSKVTIRPGQPGLFGERTSHVVAVSIFRHPRTPSHNVVYLA